MRPLGVNQRAVLSALRRHGHWYVGCGWVYSTTSGTRRLLDSLVTRGLVTRIEKPNRSYDRYYPKEES